MRYGLNDSAPDKVFKLPPCDVLDPHSIPENATVLIKVPPKTTGMNVQLTYVDGTQSAVRKFGAKSSTN